MEYQYWDTAAAVPVLPHNNCVPAGPFPVNVSSYFKRPSKVVKPSSRNNSPRMHGRRRMTTTGHFPARTRSVVDSQRASMPQIQQYSSTPSRPISWHSHSRDEVVRYHNNLQAPNHPGMTESFMTTPYTTATAEMSGLVTPMSFPILDEPQIQELITPLEGLSANDAANQYRAGQDFSMESWLQSQQQIKMPQNNFAADMYPTLTYPIYYPSNQYAAPVNAITVHTSSTPLLTSDMGSPFADDDGQHDPDAPGEKDELVGMGLYDSPAQVHSSSFLFAGFGTIKRKSLKLEDAFEPTPDDDNDDDDDDDEDDDCEDEDDDEASGASLSTSGKDSNLAPIINIEVTHDPEPLGVPPGLTYMSSDAAFMASQEQQYPHQQYDNYTMMASQQWQMYNQAGHGWI